MARDKREYVNLSEGDVTTVLADDIRFKGTLNFKSSLMIKGIFEGEIESEGFLVIAEGARVTANIKTSILVVKGQLDGNVVATESIVLSGTSRQKGDITTPKLIVESGAVFNGKSSMQEPPIPKDRDVSSVSPD